MDRIIGQYKTKRDRDLQVCFNEGTAYQSNLDIAVPVQYDQWYFDKYTSYEGSDIANKLVDGRIDLIKKWCHPGGKSLDIGIGSGELIKKAKDLLIYGYDINPYGVEWLKSIDRYIDLYKVLEEQDQTKKLEFDYLFFDSLEHIRHPHLILDKILSKTIVCISVPIIKDIKNVRESKHYRPNEHFYYWTHLGFVNWVQRYNFKVRDISNFEIVAGREDIYTFVIEKL